MYSTSRKYFLAVCYFLGILLADSAVAGEFKIVYPTSKSRVQSEVVQLRGSGADPSASLMVDVVTNAKYTQDGAATINPDGTWLYDECHLAGRGIYNNHIINVTQIKNGKREQTVTIRGIVRE